MAEPSNADQKNYQVALNNCASEPIHIPSRVQSFGALIGYSLTDGTICHATENLEQVAGIPSSVLGQPFAESVDGRLLHHEIRGVIGLPTIHTQRERIGRFELNGHPVDASVHISDETIVLELERDEWPESRPTNSVSQVRSMLACLKSANGIDDLLQEGCDALRRLTGFDRVMGYRFLPGGDGEVAVESRTPNIAAFVGLRYPASDIPSQVRQAMLKMPFRCIADIQSESSELKDLEGHPPLDMTFTHLKAVSPIHIEYLKNMGVRSTINIPLIVRGELWGLFALHHRRPRLPSPTARAVCELFGHFCSLEVQQAVEADVVSHRRRSISLQRSLKRSDAQQFDLGHTIVTRGHEFTQLIDADGVAFVRGPDAKLFGSTPSESDIREMIVQFQEDVHAVDSAKASGLLPAATDNADANPTAGVLALVLSEADRSYLTFFRDEEVTRIRWGGNPEKRIEFGPNGPRLHPRASFDEYVETIQGRSRPWEVNQIAAATELRTSLIELLFQEANSSTHHWRKQKEYQDLLIAELNHRVKNVLALVRSIARQTKTSARSLHQFTESFEQRISALASAHDLVGGSGGQWAPLRSIVETELRPFMQSTASIQIDGPDVLLKSDIAPVMALVIHELVTNAVKHGALSVPDGSLQISWRERSGGVELMWVERTEENIEVPTANGFGMTLIRHAVPKECRGESSVEFHSKGLDTRFWLPYDSARFLEAVDQSVDSLPDHSGLSVSVATADHEAQPARHIPSVLIAEDKIILLVEMESALRQIGCHEIYTASNAETALELAKSQQYSLAILDINLGGSLSFDAANALVGQGVPVIFVTGYGEIADVPDALQHIPRLSKPVGQNDLKTAIYNMLDEKGGEQ